MSTHVPQLEKLATTSPLSTAPTAMTPGALAGEKLQASALEFPAATTTTSPAETSSDTSPFTSESLGPPKLMFTIPTPPEWLSKIQLIPSANVVVFPLPEQSNTLTGMTLDSFATP